ncbi:MAG TPA: hypothetical protein VKB87_25980 [Myxococcaceae bacterium]|nr:hypothetical protein [Myxococcaceae bacterium]
MHRRISRNIVVSPFAVHTAIALSCAALSGAALAQEVRPPTGAQQMQRAAREEAEREGPEQEKKTEAGAPETQSGAQAEEEKRAAPNYDGRGPKPTTFGEGLLWVPRVILSPLWLISKYVIAAPLGALVTTAEKNHWPTWLIDFFTFGEEHQAGWIPLLLYDFGLRPTFGVYFFWNRALSRGNSLAATAVYGGNDWFALGLSGARKFSDRTSLSLGASLARRPDAPFYGIGPSSDDALRSRYAFQRVEASTVLEWRPAYWSVLRATVGFRDFKFRTGSCCNDPSVGDRIALGQLPPPPGFGQPYSVWLGRANVELDSRRPRPASQSGARLALNVEEDVDTFNTPHSWIRYGGTVGGFWDVTGQARVLSLSVITTFVDQTAGSVIPFTELATLGGAQPFVGFLPGRLYDRSAIAAQLRYEWPIWAFIDGELNVAVGNVFGEHLDGLRAGLMRLSSGFGFRSSRDGGPGFEFLIGIGTEPFDTGFRVSSFRFVIGSTYGF